MPSFITWTSYENMKDGQYFSLSQENSSTYSTPISDKRKQLYFDASYLDYIGTWIIYLYLMFPEALNSELPRTQLTAALNDRTVVVLYRDELIDAVHEYNILQKTSRQEVKVPTKFISAIIYGSLSKKRIKKSNKLIMNIDGLTSRHKCMRELLRREIRGLLDIANELPGVIPVKLSMFMACLALARYEIYWVFTHLSLKNNKTKLQYLFNQSPYLPDLMFYCIKLSKIILKNQDLIYKYYVEQLKLDLYDIIPFINQMRKLNKLDVSVLDLIDNILKILKNQLNRVDDIHLKSMGFVRLLWYRASVDMSNEPSVLRLPQGLAIAKLVNPLMQHTCYLDRLEKEINARCSMATLWFYRSYLAQIFNTYCLGRYNNNRKKIKYNRQGRYWIVFLQIYSQALRNVHRQRPEEFSVIGLGSLQKVETYLNAITSKIEICMKNILGEYTKLNKQIDAETVAIQLIKHNVNNYNYNLRGGWKSLPGFESFYPNRHYLDTLKYNLDIIGDIASSFTEIDYIVIYNQKIYPNAYLYQTLNDFFYNEIRLMACETSKTMVRPKKLLLRLDRLFRTAAGIGRYVNIDLENMIKKILYNDFYDGAVGMCGGSLGKPVSNSNKNTTIDNIIGENDHDDDHKDIHPNMDDNKLKKKKANKKRKLIHDIRDWYVGIIESKCCRPDAGVLWSPLLDGFYESKIRNNTSIEHYCSISELECLCKLIGPSGVRVIDLEILKIGHNAMKSIKNVLQKNRYLILSIDVNKFSSYSDDKWLSIIKQFNGLDVISQKGITIGNVILFRKLLRKALYNVVNGNISGFYSSTMKLISTKLFKERIFFEPISDLALDCGCVDDFTDNIMRNVYYQLANNDGKLWLYIPLIFGICFIDKYWINNNLKYNNELGALSNNGFVLGNAVKEMITIYTSKARHRKNKLLFLDITGKTLLYLKRLYPNKQSINSLFLFLDYFIEINKTDLTLMDLDSFGVPYDIIRAQTVKTLGDYPHYGDCYYQDVIDVNIHNNLSNDDLKSNDK